LPEGQNTVGTEICVKHIKATPIGDVVYAEAELIEVEGRKLIFKVSAWDNEGEIGSGTHTRFIIDSKRFMDKLKK
jgi:predicted thioesterase